MSGRATTRRGLLLGCVAGAGGVGIAAPGVVLPDVADALHVTEDATAWIMAAYVLSTGIAMALGGRALDLLGSRRVVAAGVVTVLIGSIAAAAAPGFAVVVAGRFLQGVGTAWLSITAFHALSYIDGRDRERAGGVLTAVAFTGMAAGPLVGALVDEVAGWRAVLACAAIAVLPAPFVLRGVPRTVPAVGRLDLRGAAYATVASVSIAAILQSRSTKMGAAEVAVLAAVAATTMALLVRHLRGRPDGFIPTSVLRNRELLRLSLAAATVQAAYAGLVFAAPLLLARELGWSPLETGVALLPGALIAAGAAHLSGTVGQRLGTAELMLVFCAVAAVGLAIVGLGSSVASLVVGGALLAIAPIAGVQTVMLGRIAVLVGEKDVGAATGAFTFVFITGATVGVAAAGGLGSITGLDVAVALLVALPVAGMVIALQIRAAAPQLVRA